MKFTELTKEAQERAIKNEQIYFINNHNLKEGTEYASCIECIMDDLKNDVYDFNEKGEQI